jgi:hypothetical protein
MAGYKQSAAAFRTPPSSSLRDRQRAANGTAIVHRPRTEKFEVSIKLPSAVYGRLASGAKNRRMEIADLAATICAAVITRGSISAAVSAAGDYDADTKSFGQNKRRRVHRPKSRMADARPKYLA